MPPCPLLLSTHGKIRTFTFHGLNVTTPANWSTWVLALSTRFELAIFSVTGRRELQASLRERFSSLFAELMQADQREGGTEVRGA
jgi:hypothetical protein